MTSEGNREEGKKASPSCHGGVREAIHAIQRCHVNWGEPAVSSEQRSRGIHDQSSVRFFMIGFFCPTEIGAFCPTLTVPNLHGTGVGKSYIGELERAVNGCYKRWYHLTREWKSEHPDEYNHYLKLKRKRPDQAEKYRQIGWKSVNIRPHDLRHSFCEWCITNGVDVKTVSSWMGHADQRMIMSVYDHVTNERETKSVEKLNALFDENS